MLYPSKYILITEMDVEKNKAKCTENKKCVLDNEKKLMKLKDINRSSVETNLLSFCDGIQKSAAGVIAERSWQDMLMNPAYTQASDKSEFSFNLLIY
jgi:hypothetical protein